LTYVHAWRTAVGSARGQARVPSLTERVAEM